MFAPKVVLVKLIIILLGKLWTCPVLLAIVTLVLLVPMILSIKFRWDEAWQIGLGLITGVMLIVTIANSIVQTKHVKYKEIDVEIAKTNAMVFVDLGNEYITYETVHDLKCLNDSTIFYRDITVNIWGYEFEEEILYEIE